MIFCLTIRDHLIPAARLGHADHEALPEPAGLAGGPVLLVHHTSVAILALLALGKVITLHKKPLGV